MSNFAWTEAEFDRSEDQLLREAFIALTDGNNSAERFRLLEIIKAKKRGGPRSSTGKPDPAQAGPRPPRWIGRFGLEPDGVYRIIPGSESSPPTGSRL